MRKLYFLCLLFLAGVSQMAGVCHSAPVKYVQIATATTGATLQAGTTAGFYVSSGTVIWLNASTMTVQNINSTFIGHGRNRIINGDMHIDQRTAGTVLSIPYNEFNRWYHVDRFYWTGVASPGGLYTATQLSSSSAPGFSEYVQARVNTANAVILATNTYLFVHRIEGNRVKDFGYGTPMASNGILSFWVRSSTVGTLGGSLVNIDSSRSYPFAYTISKINTWEKKAVSIPGDTTGTWSTGTLTGMKFSWNLGNGSNFAGPVNTWASALYYGPTVATTTVIGTAGASWDITGIQWEIGTVATNFEYRPEQEELRLCQRFFEKSYELTTATAASTATGLQYVAANQIGAAEVFSQTIPFQVIKRVAPAVTLYLQTGTNGQWTWFGTAGGTTSRVTTVLTVDARGFTVDQAVAVEYLARGHWCADAEY